MADKKINGFPIIDFRVKFINCTGTSSIQAKFCSQQNVFVWLADAYNKRTGGRDYPVSRHIGKPINSN